MNPKKHRCFTIFVKTLSKGLPKTQQLSKEFGLIFRANGDTGPERERATPDEETIESNLEMFLKKWESQLPVATMESIKNLRKHIRKGCCSAIPAGAGTQRNERLHKSLKRSLLGGASTVSPELAVAVFSIVLYVWSYKRKPGVTKHMSNARVILLAPIELFVKIKITQRRLCGNSTVTHQKLNFFVLWTDKEICLLILKTLRWSMYRVAK